MLMQFSHEYLFDIPQNAFADMFDFLYTNNNIPRPIIELEREKNE